MTRTHAMDTAAILRAAGLTVVDVRIPGRGHLEIRGGMFHHDAIGPITRARGVAVMQQGRPDLKGPLCNAWLDRVGAWCLITDQRANHAGNCSSVALNEAMRGQAPDRDAAVRGLTDDTTIGNRYFYGIEVSNNGVGEPYSDVQIDSLARGCAALNKAWGLTSGHWLHHRQATRRKIDMSYRGDLRGLIDQHMEDDMAAPPKLLRVDGQWYMTEGRIAKEISDADAYVWGATGVEQVPDAVAPMVLRAMVKGGL